MSKSRRKVIQIATAADHDNAVVIALCDDGSIWKVWMGSHQGWQQIDTALVETADAKS